MNKTDISNRHFLPASGLQNPDSARTVNVNIYVAPPWHGSIAGQHLVTSLINVLCRQTDLITKIHLVCHDATLLVPLPGMPTTETLVGALEKFVPWVIGDKISFSVDRSLAVADITIVIGCPDQCEVDVPDDALFVIGSGWRAWIGEFGSAPESVVPDKSDPIGPFLAASFVAGEVFKIARGVTKGIPIKGQGYSLWSRLTSIDWNQLEDGPIIFNRSLPPMHLVGAGAVGQALIYTLVAANVHADCLVVMDDDSHDSTNLNRCMLAGLRDIDAAKVAAIERYTAYRPLTVVPFFYSIQGYLQAPKSKLPDGAAERARAYNFPIVISCVDKNVSRHSIQGLWPEIIFGGSTLGLRSRSDVYDLKSRTACLACHSPPENEGEKIRKFEAVLRAMSKTDRQLYLEEHGLSVEAIEDYLASPECGKVGESILRDHASQGDNEFSVGFVSLSAGVLLASELFKRLLFPKFFSDQQPMSTINFLNGKMGTGALSIDTNCPLECSKYREIGA